MQTKRTAGGRRAGGASWTRGTGFHFGFASIYAWLALAAALCLSTAARAGDYNLDTTYGNYWFSPGPAGGAREPRDGLPELGHGDGRLARRERAVDGDRR